MEKVYFRCWPKQIFSWPSAVAALLAGIAVQVSPEHAQTIGLLFILIFFLNLMVLGFEFSRAISLTLFFALTATIVSALWINQKFGFIAEVQQFLGARNLQASSEFYFSMAGFYFLFFFLLFLKTRFDYWELSPNELLHKKGLFGKNERYSTERLRLTTDIPDIFEYLVGGSGQITLKFPDGQTITLDNVLGIGRIEEIADRILDAPLMRFEEQGPLYTP